MKEKLDKLLTKFTTQVSSVLGRPVVFVVALALLSVWAISGPILGFSDTWQLIINTSTTIITFLTVFIIQNTQNRDNLAINIKLDAIIKKQGIKEKDLLEAEEQSDKKLELERKKMQRNSRSRTKKRS
ncbi:MAG: low affinity iron permease family protein [Candidatus Saccharimonas sp.]